VHSILCDFFSVSIVALPPAGPRPLIWILPQPGIAAFRTVWRSGAGRGNLPPEICASDDRPTSVRPDRAMYLECAIPMEDRRCTPPAGSGSPLPQEFGGMWRQFMAAVSSSARVCRARARFCPRRAPLECLLGRASFTGSRDEPSGCQPARILVAPTTCGVRLFRSRCRWRSPRALAHVCGRPWRPFRRHQRIRCDLGRAFRRWCFYWCAPIPEAPKHYGIAICWST